MRRMWEKDGRMYIWWAREKGERREELEEVQEIDEK